MREDIAMQYFIARQNIEHFWDLLKDELDPSKRRQLEDMIAQEMAKLDGADESRRPHKLG